ncbi:methyl-accepting chemotaxis protein WspA [Candidatus Gastranaerophilus sp. (ex Termes propinquus)]|nr:methyl-accepting chemotaxis protein WspA [Candidatus Gastranaerophilus sp. (ex Termes propinquus)]
MKKIITNDLSKCVGCNRCIRVCPIEEANIARENSVGEIVVEVDANKCIACGMCINACPHGSRCYEDDTERFFRDLKAGSNISIFVAPAFMTNFIEWRQMLSWLRALGVDKVYDVAIGADICTWAHIRYVQKNPGKLVISQPCPAIVNYILRHRNALLEYLSPVHSPMLCTAVYMRDYCGVTGKIAALSPCIAKTHEFEDTGYVEYNVTFKRLKEYMEQNNVVLPHEKSDFDHIDSGLGFLYPAPGGLKECVEHYTGKAVRIDKSEGPDLVYKALDEYLEQPERNLPVVFDVLNCMEGCNHGTACLHDGNRSIFEMNTTLDEGRQKMLGGKYKKYLDKLFKKFDKTLRIESFIRRYTAHPIHEIPVNPSTIENAFLKLNKHDFKTRNYNCGACGSDTCLEMARKIAKGVNTPHNCIDKMHKDVMHEHEEYMKIQASNVKNFDVILNDTVKVKTIMEDIVIKMADVTAAIQNCKKMTSDIEKIAMQINIISLNASIEAVRAGEHGKAFETVAGEIRKLANSSRASVEDSEKTSSEATVTIASINDMIEEISKSIEASFINVTKISETTSKSMSISDY